MKARSMIRAGAGLAAVAAAAAVTGCGGGSASSPSAASAATSGATGTSGASPSASATSATSAATTAPPASASPPAASSSPPAGSTTRAVSPGGAPACATSDLRVSLGQAQGAAGSVYQNIDFTNVTSKPCSLYGFPGVSLLGGTPAKQIGAAAERSPQASPALVTIQAGGTATALLRVTEAQNYPSSTCDPVQASTLLVYPPNQTAAVSLPYKSMGCAASQVKLMTIGVIQAGTGG